MDCLEGMEYIQDKSIDMILADLPYGTTQNKWDTVINLQKLWEQYNRIVKDEGAIILTAQPPFDKALACSNLKMFRYEWIWEKSKATGFLNAKKMPLKAHENILVFYKRLPIYNPQKTTGHTPVNRYTKRKGDGSNYGKTAVVSGGGNTDRYPRDVLKFKNVINPIHPTQKPVALFEYLIRTYTNEGNIVLDNCIGSGTTAEACIRTRRDFIGFEIEEKYCSMAEERLKRIQLKIV